MVGHQGRLPGAVRKQSSGHHGDPFPLFQHGRRPISVEAMSCSESRGLQRPVRQELRAQPRRNVRLLCRIGQSHLLLPRRRNHPGRRMAGRWYAWDRLMVFGARDSPTRHFLHSDDCDRDRQREHPDRCPALAAGMPAAALKILRDQVLDVRPDPRRRKVSAHLGTVTRMSICSPACPTTDITLDVSDRSSSSGRREVIAERLGGPSFVG